MKKYLVNVNGTEYAITVEEMAEGAAMPQASAPLQHTCPGGRCPSSYGSCRRRKNKRSYAGHHSCSQRQQRSVREKG